MAQTIYSFTQQRGTVQFQNPNAQILTPTQARQSNIAAELDVAVARSTGTLGIIPLRLDCVAQAFFNNRAARADLQLLALYADGAALAGYLLQDPITNRIAGGLTSWTPTMYGYNNLKVGNNVEATDQRVLGLAQMFFRTFASGLDRVVLTGDVTYQPAPRSQNYSVQRPDLLIQRFDIR